VYSSRMLVAAETLDRGIFRIARNTIVGRAGFHAVSNIAGT